MKQKNNHARSKQKRKVLRFKNMLRAIYERMIGKRMQENESKGHTLKGRKAKDVAIYVRGRADLFDHGHALRLNQRQKRKRARQVGRPIK